MMPGPIECYAVMDGDVPLGFHASGESASTIASIFRLPVVPGYFVPREHVCEDYWKLFDKHGNLAVTYTHLPLPTSRPVYVSTAPAHIHKKDNNRK